MVPAQSELVLAKVDLIQGSIVLVRILTRRGRVEAEVYSIAHHPAFRCSFQLIAHIYQ